MAHRNDRRIDDLAELSAVEMEQIHGGTDEAGDLAPMLDGEDAGIAVGGYIRVKKLTS